MIITAIGLIAVFFLKEIELRGGRRMAEKKVEQAAKTMEQPVSIH